MSKINKLESGMVMKMMETPGWGALMKLVATTINELNAREVTGQNEFEIIRSVFIREGRVGALKEFFNDIENGNSLSGEATRGQM
jgi:hypothetical protein